MLMFMPGDRLVLIYHTRGEHASHYTTDAVNTEMDIWWKK
jgi:hypothetical protein